MDNSTKANFKVIQMVYASLIIGVVAFLVFTVITIPMSVFKYNDHSEFVYLVPAFFVGAVFLSNFLFNRSVLKILKTDSLFQKLTKYQSAIIMKGAPLEGAGLMAVVATFTTSNYYYLVFAIVALFLMLLNFPSKNKFENLVELSFEDKSRLAEM